MGLEDKLPNGILLTNPERFVRNGIVRSAATCAASLSIRFLRF